jgi:hypothetical protein
MGEGHAGLPMEDDVHGRGNKVMGTWSTSARLPIPMSGRNCEGTAKEFGASAESGDGGVGSDHTNCL